MRISDWSSDVCSSDLESRTVENRSFVLAVLGETVDFLPLDRHGALVLVDTVAIEHADFHDRTGNARWQAKRGVAHVTRLFSEAGAEEFFFRRHRAPALRRDLTYQDRKRVG